jgi:hypothetical protein
VPAREYRHHTLTVVASVRAARRWSWSRPAR